MSQPPIFTTGAEAQVGPRLAPRRSIHDIVNDKDQKHFSLYVLALQRWYEKLAESKDASTWQISGIHGLPFERWNGAGPEKPVTPEIGYCHHSTILFPTWHRPYCALYEQMLHQYALDVAQSFTTPDRDDWIKAADTLRLPYWDWSIDEYPPDAVYKSQKVTVTLPSGKTDSINNPILKYTYKAGHGPPPPKGSESLLVDLTNMATTARYVGYPNPIADFERYLHQQFRDMNQHTAQMLLYMNKWDDFSTKAVLTKGSGASMKSLESIHDSMHIAIGGGRYGTGHMSWQEVAAFDPIFWLHHANVDRLLGLWQAINYDVKIVPRKAGAGNGTWNTPEDALLTGTTELEPFRAGPNSDVTMWWQSDACRKDPATLQYTYPELEGLDPDPATASRQVRELVEKRYNNFKLFPAFQAPVSHAHAPQQATLAARQASSARAPESVQWSVRIRGTRADLKPVVSILVFLGGVPSGSGDFVTDPHYVGEFSPFINTLTEQCANCARNEALVVEGYVHITGNMMERGVDVLNTRGVEEYLRNNLKWIPLLRNGEYGRAEDIPSLEVLVISTPLEARGNVALPEVGPLEKHNGVTFDLPGGRARDPNRA